MNKALNDYELRLMRQSGKISAQALKRAIEAIKINATGLEIDKIVQREIYKLGGDLSYKTVPDYHFATCVTINEQVVHGIPTDYKFKEGDVVSVDLASMYKGWHTDTAWSVLLGKDVEKEKFLIVGAEALWLGIKQAIDGNRVGDISEAIQTKVESAGYSVVRTLVGHGVGKRLHQDPEIPGFGKRGTGPVLKSGMSIAIEVIYTSGRPEVILEKDNWTISTADGSWGGLFEMTVVVGREEAEVLTDWHKSKVTTMG